jgi:RNA recognition motif-containing protein
MDGANKAREALNGSWIRGRVIEINDAKEKEHR